METKRKTCVSCEDKLGFMERTLKKPVQSDEDYNRWMTCDYIIICLLVNSMNEDIG